MKDYGVKGVDSLSIDFATFKKKRDAYVKRLNGIYHKNLDSSKVDYIQGKAKFVENKVLEVGSERYTADHIMIATGGDSMRIPFEGLEHCMTSDDIFHMEKLPKSVVIIGGGYIGVEMA